MKIIITEKQHKNLQHRRRFDDLLKKYITATYNWLNPAAFESFDEFLERVIFSASRDLASKFKDEGDTQDYYSIWELLKPIVKDTVMNQYYDEIEDYYNNKI